MVKIQTALAVIACTIICVGYWWFSSQLDEAHLDIANLRLDLAIQTQEKTTCQDVLAKQSFEIEQLRSNREAAANALTAAIDEIAELKTERTTSIDETAPEIDNVKSLVYGFLGYAYE